MKISQKLWFFQISRKFLRILLMKGKMIRPENYKSPYFVYLSCSSKRNFLKCPIFRHKSSKILNFDLFKFRVKIANFDRNSEFFPVFCISIVWNTSDQVRVLCFYTVGSTCKSHDRVTWGTNIHFQTIISSILGGFNT